MKFSAIFLGALAAITVSAAELNKAPNNHIGLEPIIAYEAQPATVTVTSTETLTKIKTSYATITETLTKISKVHVTETETATKYRTKTKKLCPTSSSPTQSVGPTAVKKARAFGEQPLYAREFA